MREWERPGRGEEEDREGSEAWKLDRLYIYRILSNKFCFTFLSFKRQRERKRKKKRVGGGAYQSCHIMVIKPVKNNAIAAKTLLNVWYLRLIDWLCRIFQFLPPTSHSHDSHLTCTMKPHRETLDVIDHEILQAGHGGGLAAHTYNSASGSLLRLLALHAEHVWNTKGQKEGWWAVCMHAICVRESVWERQLQLESMRG